MCVCWTRPANGCTQYFQIPVWGIPHPPASGRLRPHPCKTLGQYSTDATAAQERLGLLDILYREHYSTGLIRLKTLAGGGLCQWPTKTKRAIFLHFSGWGDGIFSKLKTNNCAGDSSISSHIVYHPISQWQNLISPTKKNNLHTRLLSIVNFLINLELGGDREKKRFKK